MSRYFICLLCSSLFLLASASLVGAAELLPEELLTAKVYREYPGYIEAPTCKNPNDLSTPILVPAAAIKKAAEPAKDPVVLEIESVEPVVAEEVSAAGEESSVSNFKGRFYLGVYGIFNYTTSDELDFDSADIDVEYDMGYGFGLLGGVDFGAFRFDLDGSYRTNEVDDLDAYDEDGDLNITAIMVNAYYDFESVDPVMTPYLVLGVGYAEVELESFEGNNIELVDDDDTVWAVQVGCGLQFDLNNEWALDLGYRFMTMDDPDLTGTFGDLETTIESHNVIFGVSFKF